VPATRRAVKLLRQAGFKIHAHWMANLYGSSVAQDQLDYTQLFADPDFRPDELKIYPCSLIGSAELMQYYQKGLWKPYEYEELLEVLTYCLSSTPGYCRLTRVIRDIPSTDIVEGNKLTNFRQIAEAALKEAGEQSHDIRAREIKNLEVEESDLSFELIEYETSVSTERFLQFVVNSPRLSQHQGKLAGFLRLSFPKEKPFIAELVDAAMIREIHVYGQSIELGKKALGKAQHLGLGTKLISYAKEMAQNQGYKKLAVISAVGTREYYRKRGFKDGQLYQWLEL
jgi:elongator complex protein 3